VCRWLRTGGEHALDEIPDITQDNPVSFGSVALGREWLYLNTLTYWHRKIPLESVWFIKDGAERC
jgi:hypothetical protein